MLKVAVPSRGHLVDEHFGHCEAFTIFSVGEDKEIVEETRLTPPPACGCKSNLISTLVEMGISVLVAGGMGQGAVSYLNQNGIKVVRGAAGPVRGAVRAWLDGSLEDSAEVCQAHGSEGCSSH
ncbi:NifB/NifX family molybdenum-iron cluster-binding protein [Telmatospirillum siberiense]|uniref:Dinitrogenase iron-molybdenum cofactor biosynthesis protein n=1 Tax=Telmatospirillum siberiense TaxID=382514 RepID=A0A2N3PYB3_9PROT|nr:NifB/NifX family molybdenum-iron cluster-binding protein [Telmatospirillum siberiense]PKU25365.1 dinitrogenase iron-molybdenum cofactor biosynthesis protein [Telmatospirillum siberiense]